MAVVVSACLLGENCKYNGGNNYHADLQHLLAGKELILICPEVAGGLPVPRDPAEIVNGIVTNTRGICVDEAFREGTVKEMGRLEGKQIEFAVLQSRSPSCGCRQVYDGTFSKTLIPGQGICARAMMESGYLVYDVEEFLQEQTRIGPDGDEIV